MSWPETIAFGALIIGMIVFLGVMLDGYKSRLKNRSKELELRVRLAESESQAGAARAGEMEQRLRVLERIATDRKHLLADEIEALREKEPVK